MQSQKIDTAKLGELILYIASKSQDDPAFGTAKLNKILFTVDFFTYGILGHSLTNATYIRLEYSPSPRELNDVRDQLISEGRAAVQTGSYIGKPQKRLVALAAPDMSLFSAEERALVDDLINELKPLNATQFSTWTHTLSPWLSATDYEEIPYNTVFVMKNEPASREAMIWAINRLEELRESGELP